MLTMIYMTRIQNMSFFLLKVNNPSVRHPVWPRVGPVWPPCGPRRAPRPAPALPLSGTPVGHPVRPPRCPRRAPRPAPVRPPSGTPVWPPCGPRRAPPSTLPSGPPSGPLFGRSQGYKFAQICITSALLVLPVLRLWLHYCGSTA
jgi:hypothetical protein